jgi:hypothetical protein
VNETRGRLMDAAAIMAELGVTRAQADRIIRWCHEHGAGAIRPAGGLVERADARKLYVERADVEAWLEASTRSAEREHP